MASQIDTKAFISGLPKAELHVHLEGCLTPPLASTLATRNGITLPATVSEASTDNGFAFHDLTSFLAVYYPALSVMQTASDFHDLAMDYLTKAHSNNVLHCELFFDPQAHTSRGIPFPIVIGGYRSAVLQAEREFGISASLIMCFMRDMSAEFAMATLMEALPYRDSIIGVGLDSDERGNPPEKFRAVFERARREGFLLTSHCDIDQVNSIEHIRQVVQDIKVDRIDHGTNIVEDSSLVEEILRYGIGLTCCPVSNSVVTKDFKGKEILTLLRQGVKITINSDDPAYFRAYINGNLEKLAGESDITNKELVLLMKNAFDISWISGRKRDTFLRKLNTYAAAKGVAI